MYAGHHTIDLKISDMQGQFGVYNLSVAVCDCSVTSDCRNRRGTSSIDATGALGVVFASLFLLLRKNHWLQLVSEYTLMCIVTVLIFCHHPHADSSAAARSLHDLQKRVHHFADR